MRAGACRIHQRDKSRNEKKLEREYLQLASPPFLFALVWGDEWGVF